MVCFCNSLSWTGATMTRSATLHLPISLTSSQRVDRLFHSANELRGIIARRDVRSADGDATPQQVHNVDPPRHAYPAQPTRISHEADGELMVTMTTTGSRGGCWTALRAKGGSEGSGAVREWLVAAAVDVDVCERGGCERRLRGVSGCGALRGVVFCAAAVMLYRRFIHVLLSSSYYSHVASEGALTVYHGVPCKRSDLSNKRSRKQAATLPPTSNNNDTTRNTPATPVTPLRAHRRR